MYNQVSYFDMFDLNERMQSLTLSHTQWCIDVFVNPVITSVIYKFLSHHQNITI